MDYAIIAPVVAYLVAVQLTNRFDLHPITGSVIATVVPFLLGVTVRWIMYASHVDTIWANVFDVKILLYFAVQFVAIGLLLKFMKETDSMATYFALGVIGFGVVIGFMLI